jgi:hypothetical protein
VNASSAIRTAFFSSGGSLLLMIDVQTFFSDLGFLISEFCSCSDPGRGGVYIHIAWLACRRISFILALVLRDSLLRVQPYMSQLQNSGKVFVHYSYCAYRELQSQRHAPRELPDCWNHSCKGLIRFVPVHRLVIILQEAQTFTKSKLSNSVRSQRKENNVHFYEAVILEASLDLVAENVQQTVENWFHLLYGISREEGIDGSAPPMVVLLIDCSEY